MQPRARELPVALDGCRGDAQCLRDLVRSQAGKEFQLDDLSLAPVRLTQAVEGFVQGVARGGTPQEGRTAPSTNTCDLQLYRDAPLTCIGEDTNDAAFCRAPDEISS